MTKGLDSHWPMRSQHRCQPACLRSCSSAAAEPRWWSATPAGRRSPSGTFETETELFPGPACPPLPGKRRNIKKRCLKVVSENMSVIYMSCVS